MLGRGASSSSTRAGEGLPPTLVEAGAAVSCRAASGKTPLDIAKQYAQPAAASALQRRGAVAGVAG